MNDNDGPDEKIIEFTMTRFFRNKTTLFPKLKTNQASTALITKNILSFFKKLLASQSTDFFSGIRSG